MLSSLASFSDVVNPIKNIVVYRPNDTVANVNSSLTK